MLGKDKVSVKGMNSQYTYGKDEVIQLGEDFFLNMTFNGCVYNNKVWYVTYYGCLICVDIIEKKIVIAKQLIHSNITFPYISMAIVRDVLVIIPYNSNMLFVYNIQNDELYSEKITNREIMCFFSSVVYKNDLYFIPTNANSIMKFEVENCKIEKFFDISDIIGKDDLFSLRSCIVGDNIYCLQWDSNIVWQLNINTLQLTSIELEIEDKFYNIIECNEGFFAGATNEALGVYYDIKKEEKKVIYLDEVIDEKNIANGFELHNIDGVIYYIPYYCSYIILIDVEKGTAKRCETKVEGRKVGISTVYNKQVLYLPLTINNCITMSNGEIIYIDNDKFFDIYQDDFGFGVENHDYKLEGLLRKITKSS